METNQEARLRLFLAEYERVCTRYSLMVYDGGYNEDRVHERLLPNKIDALPQHIEHLKEGGINA